MKQTIFALLAWSNKGKVTRRERFLAEMNAVIPWARLLRLIEPYYPKPGKGTRPLPMERNAHLSHAELVQPVGPRSRGRAV
jgi:IS5 family transposase